MQLTEDHETQAYCYAAIAAIYFDLGRFAEALEMIERAMVLDPDEEEYKESSNRIAKATKKKWPRLF